MYAREHDPEPDYSPSDLAVYFAQHGDPAHAARLLEDCASIDVSSLRDDEVADLSTELARRGLILVSEEIPGAPGASLVMAAATCLYCRMDHAAGDHEVCVGATPADELDDSDDTGAQCSSCLHAVQGPPAPYCCAARQKLIEALHGDEAMRIKPCPLCHGTGALSHGLPCDRCSATGVAGVRS
jgi:hypothetical protein